MSNNAASNLDDDKFSGSSSAGKLTLKFNLTEQDLGRADTLRHTILTFVAAENYPRAIEELRAYSDTKLEYPQFKVRAGRYITYAIDLINGIKAKRSFPGMQHLAMSKQQELFDRAMDHFDDLKATLRKIEQIEKEVKLEDLRSTVWVIKALVYSFFAILALALLMEVSKGIVPSAGIVIDDFFGNMTDWAFSKIGL